jgi:hypothetical protein
VTNGWRLTGTSLMLLLLGCTGFLVGGIFGYLNYTNPYSYVPTPQVALIDTNVSPAANYTIIFVLDGVRADFFYETRKSGIDAYGDWANLTDVECSRLLSVSRAGYGLISSGVNTSESQVISNDHTGSFGADSLWKTSLRNGGTTAFVGSATWHELFGDWMNYSVTFQDTYPGEATVALNITSGGSPIEDNILAYSDAIASDYAVNIVSNHLPTLMVVHFSETDEIGHDLGPLSDANTEALQRQDSYISEILSVYDSLAILDSTLVVVTSDHGQVAFPDRGGQHGGAERAALHIPLLLRGPHVLPGIYADSHHQNSIAPTVSVLMGWDIPSDASGKALFECLNLSTREEAVHRINQAGLRLGQATYRVQAMGYAYLFESQLDSAGAALSEAETNYVSSEYEAALTYAKLAESQSNAVLTMSWNSKVSEEISVRFVGLLIILGILCGIIVVSAGGRSRLRSLSKERVSLTLTIFASSLYLALLALIPSLSGWQFSASYIAAYLYEFIYLISAASLVSFFVAFIVLNILARVTSRDVSQLNLLDILKRFLLITVAVYFLAFAFFVGINSFGLPWYSIDITVPLMYFFILLSGIFFVVYAIFSLPAIRWFQQRGKAKGLQT